MSSAVRLSVIAVLVLLAGTSVAAGAAPAGKRRKPAPLAWASATAFARPAFSPSRMIDVASASDFWTAWDDLHPGDLIRVHGVQFTGEQVFEDKQLPGWAEIFFDARTRFLGVGDQGDFPAVWINKVSHVRFYGSVITNPRGSDGVLVYDSSHVTWWGFVIHDVGGTGLFTPGITRANDHLDFKGEISRWSENLAWDPHAEKGTGLHGANIGDFKYGVRDSRFVLDLHDGAGGAGVEIGGANPTDGVWHNTFYLRCRRLTKRAVSQVAGNCLQVWGENVIGNRIKYLEAENLQGRPYDTNGLYSDVSLASNTIAYGRAARTNLNRELSSTEPIPASMRWDRRGSTVFRNVVPKP